MIFEGMSVIEQMVLGALLAGALMDGIFLWWCVIHIKALEAKVKKGKIYVYDEVEI